MTKVNQEKAKSFVKKLNCTLQKSSQFVNIKKEEVKIFNL